MLDGVITEDVTEHCATEMSTTIGTIITALSRLPEGVSVPLGAIADVVGACVEQGYRMGRRTRAGDMFAESE